MNEFLLGYVITSGERSVPIGFNALGFCGPLGGDNGGIAALFQGIKSEIRRGGVFCSVGGERVEELKAIHDCIIDELARQLNMCISGEFNGHAPRFVAGFSSKNLLDLTGKINGMKKNYILGFSSGGEIDLSDGVWYDLKGVKFREYGLFSKKGVNSDTKGKNAQ